MLKQHLHPVREVGAPSVAAVSDTDFASSVDVAELLVLKQHLHPVSEAGAQVLL